MLPHRREGRWPPAMSRIAPTLRALRTRQCGRAHHDFRDRDRGGVLAVRGASRPMSCCWKPVSAARLDATNVVDRPIADDPHAGQHGSHGISWRHADRHRRREGRHHQARRPGLRRAGAGGDVEVEAQAKRMRAPMRAAGQQWHVGVERGRLVYQDERGLMDLAAPKLFGRHQFDDAGPPSRHCASAMKMRKRRASVACSARITGTPRSMMAAFASEWRSA